MSVSTVINPIWTPFQRRLRVVPSASALMEAILNLKTAVESRQKVQDFESESLGMGAEHSQKG